MNLGELVEEIYVRSGNLTTLEPHGADGEIDLLTPGSKLILGWINRAMLAISAWKRPQNRQFAVWRRSPELKFLVIEPGEVQTAGNESTADVVYLPSVPAGVVGKFLFLVDTQEFRQIVAQGVGYVVLDRPFEFSIPTFEVRILSNYAEIPESEFWLGINQIVGLPDRNELDMIRSNDYFVRSGDLVVGQPTSWYRSGRRIYIDTISPEIVRLGLVVIQPPRKFDSGSSVFSVPDLPETFHQGIVLWSLIQAFSMAQETTMSYATSRQFEEFMMTTQTMLDFEDQDQSLNHSVRS